MLTKAEFAQRIKNACAAVIAAEAELTEIDAKFGDADHGFTMAKVCNAIIAAMADLKKGKTGDIPRQLQNVHADTTGFDNQQHYLYPHVFPNRWVEQQYLPTELVGKVFYEPSDNGYEKKLKEYWSTIKKTNSDKE